MDRSEARRAACERLARSMRPGRSRDESMRAAADALWESLSPLGVSWIGFYVKVDGRDEMILGPSRDKPACSPIGLHGVCGRGWRERAAIVVRDVRTLGAGYVACDPRDMSEVVVPCTGRDGTCWGVLDADSHQVNEFAESDAGALHALLIAVGLTNGAPRTLVV